MAVEKSNATGYIKDIMSMVYLFIICCAFMDHLRDPEAFFGRLFGSEIMDENPRAWQMAIVIGESTTGALLFHPRTRQAGLAIATSLLLVLLLYTAYIYCFTNHGTLIYGILATDRWYQHTWLHVVLLGGSLLTYFQFLKQRYVMRSNKHHSVNI